jgi:hydrogenase maturation protein HypF
LIRRIHIAIRGAVQGVGFRPFVYRLAGEMQLPGWVRNSAQGVFVEVEGRTSQLELFLLRLEKEKPAPSFIQSLEFSFLDPVPYHGFEILPSDPNGSRSALILPDIATCPQCLAEVFDISNRRYRYPFTNCTHCGPRFTIIESLPYDRPNTSMAKFEMCPECRREYEDPEDRRFHAQPNACPACGPHLELWNAEGEPVSFRCEALLEAAALIRSGVIVAVKGLGGFHIFADGRNQKSVESLRLRKHREEKPFALMYPSLECIQKDCEVSALERRLLTSSECPIVLLRRRIPAASGNGLCGDVAPRNPYLGIMLPYTPLHHLLMRELGFPVVATSGNISEEPICTDEGEALKRLAGIADYFLVHDRPIVRHLDDSIVRVMLDRELVLRRARGYAPLPLRPGHLAPQLLAAGGHLKNTVAISVGNDVFISQHIGDLQNKEAAEAFRRVIEDFRSLYQVHPSHVAADLHPDYLSTRVAKEIGLPLMQIQHHYAHVASCMAENQLEGRVLGVSWDGTGYGTDGVIWGGEFLLTDEASFERVGSFRRFRLPGSEKAVREPRRAAVGLLFETMGGAVFERPDLAPVSSFRNSELPILRRMLTSGLNSPWTSSAGRLFDAVASIAGLRQRASFEGQAAMELEFAREGYEGREAYPIDIVEGDGGILTVDWERLALAVLSDCAGRGAVGEISNKFHNALAEAVVAVASRIGEPRVVLTGGCFQNRYLTERTVGRLAEEGFRPYWHQRVPPNDGGISLGQIVAASRAISPKRSGGI